MSSPPDEETIEAFLRESYTGGELSDQKVERMVEILGPERCESAVNLVRGHKLMGDHAPSWRDIRNAWWFDLPVDVLAKVDVVVR